MSAEDYSVFFMEKLAEPEVVRVTLENSVSKDHEFQKKLKPGDILLTAPRPSDTGKSWFLSKVYKPISRFIQGTDFGHAAMYAGEGKVIDIRFDGIEKVPLRKITSWNNVVAVRPKATSSERDRALAYAHKMVGKAFDFKALVMAATPFRGTRAGNEAEKAEKFFCSALIANAYPRLKFSANARLRTRPGEIIASEDVKPVAALEKKSMNIEIMRSFAKEMVKISLAKRADMYGGAGGMTSAEHSQYAQEAADHYRSLGKPVPESVQQMLTQSAARERSAEGLPPLKGGGGERAGTQQQYAMSEQPPIPLTASKEVPGQRATPAGGGTPTPPDSPRSMQQATPPSQTAAIPHQQAAPASGGTQFQQPAHQTGMGTKYVDPAASTVHPQAQPSATSTIPKRQAPAPQAAAPQAAPRPAPRPAPDMSSLHANPHAAGPSQRIPLRSGASTMAAAESGAARAATGAAHAPTSVASKILSHPNAKMIGGGLLAAGGLAAGGAYLSRRKKQPQQY